MKHFLKVVLFSIFLLPVLSSAFSVSELEDKKIYGDVLLSPGSNEVVVKPGESVEKSIFITNRLGREMSFDVQVEDFTSGGEKDEILKFLGDNYGPYSLKDYINPEISSFSLSHGEMAEVVLSIDLPQNVLPGGRYAGVFFSFSNDEKKDGTVAKARSRIGSLFFVRVDGPILESGEVVSFDGGGKKWFFGKAPVFFSSFKNDGNIYLNPYGGIDLENFLGNKVSDMEISPYFVLPKSSRISEYKYRNNIWPGLNTATLRLNRGYDDVVDNKTFSFWYFSYLHIATMIVVLIIPIVLKFRRRVKS